MTRDPEVQALLDKKAIEEVLVRYLRGADRGDMDLITAAYHDDGYEDHGGAFAGPAKEWLANLAERLPKAGLMTHLMTNLLIELDGDQALTEHFIMTFSRLPGEDGAFDSMTTSRAIDRFERRNGEWKIKKRILVWETSREFPVNETWGRGAVAKDPSVLLRSAKKPADPLYSA